MLYAVINKYLSDIPLDKVNEFEKDLSNYIDNNYPEIINSIKETKDLTEETEKKIVEAIGEFKKTM